MAEEVVVTGAENEATPLQVNEVEQRAIDMGWRPKEEFNGNEDDFIDAAEFVRRKPLFDKIENTSRELKDVKKALQALEVHHSKVRETEYQRALNDLKAQKKTALEEGDADLLISIDEQITDLKAQEQANKVVERQAAATPDPRFVQWVDKNPWYAQDNELREFADAAGLAYAKANKDLSPEDVLSYVEKRVRKAYPDKFENKKREKPSTVESGDNNAPTRKTTSDPDSILTDEERKVMNTFVRQGVMTKEKYIEQIKLVKGIK